MAKQFSKAFYKSKLWQDCRESYGKSRGWVCERCGRQGSVEVHHKIELTPENINDPSITTDWNNLCLLCRDCHRELHGQRKRIGGKYGRYSQPACGRYIVDMETGEVILKGL